MSGLTTFRVSDGHDLAMLFSLALLSPPPLPPFTITPNLPSLLAQQTLTRDLPLVRSIAGQDLTKQHFGLALSQNLLTCQHSRLS